MKTVRLIISGVVQGIGYRKWLKREANKFGVVGWVKNRSDGSVEAVCLGENNIIDMFIKQAWQGPPLAHVVQVDIQPYSGLETFSSFSVLQ
jgi:acylphosphatase